MNSSFSENDDSENECPDEYKDIFSTKNWIYEKKFANSEQAIKYLKSQQLWDIDQKKCCAVVGGYKAMYRCTHVCSPAAQCSAAKCIFFPNTSSEVLVFRSDRNHDHDTKDNAKVSNALDEKLMARFLQLIQLKMEYDDIIKQLEIEGFQFKPQQLRSELSKLRRTQTDSDHDGEWTLEKTFNCIDTITEYLRSQEIWIFTSKKPCDSGTRWHYRCNEPQCQAKIFCIQNESNSSDVLLYRNSYSHSHETQTIDLASDVTTQLRHQDSNAPTSTKPVTAETKIDRNKFKFQMSFDNIKVAEKHLRDITIWSKFHELNFRGGLREYYCCNVKDEAEMACPAQLYLLHSIKSGKIRLYRNDQQHRHTKILPSDNLNLEERLTSAENDEIILDYNECDDIIMDEVPTSELIGEEIIIGDFVDENQFAIEVNGDEWMFQKKFIHYQQALKYLADRFMILVNKQEVPLGGYQEYYRCGLLVEEGEACPVISYIEYVSEESDVLLYKNMLTHHNHDDVLPLSKVQPQKKMKYYTTIRAPATCRVINFKAIEKWLNALAIVPNHDDDKPFCANYTIDQEHQLFQCFITTKRLLKIALESRIVHADYKCTLTWQTHHILIFGTTDMDQVFHSFGVVIGPTKSESDFEFAFTSLNIGISMCYGCNYQPEMLISNSKSTIQNAFVTVYGTDQSKLITCYNYMLAEITSSLKTIVPNETIRNELIADIEMIHKVPSPEMFLEAIVLFVKKWNVTQAKFIEYFKAKWIQQNTNWYVGVSHFTPVTNEALVSEYERIMKDYNFKHNQNLAILKSFVEHVLDTWSSAYASELKSFARKPTVALTLYDEACQWNELQTPIDIEEIDTDTTYYYVPSDGTIFSHEKLAKYKSKFHENLSEFFDVQFSFWELKQIKDADITCSCPYFFEHFICKHSLGMATALNLFKFPAGTMIKPDKEEEDDDDSEAEAILS